MVIEVHRSNFLVKISFVKKGIYGGCCGDNAMQVADDDLVVLDMVHDVDEHGRYAEDVRAFVADNRVYGGLHVVTVVGHHCGQRESVERGRD